MEKQLFTRKELYDLVWTEPLLTLSKKYAISDVGLRKICKRMSIPLPKVGHWQKLRYGKRVNKVKLPANYSGTHSVSLMVRTKEMRDHYGEPTPLKILQNEIEERLKSNLVVPEKLTKPDDLITAARENLANDRHEYNGTVSTYRGFLDIKVSKKSIPRLLRFLDTLIKALRARGHDMKISSDTYVLVEGETIKVQFREKLKQELIRKIPGTGRYIMRQEYYHFKLLTIPIRNGKMGNKLLKKSFQTSLHTLSLKERKSYTSE